MRQLQASPANPGGSATAVAYDSGADRNLPAGVPQPEKNQRIRLAVFVDQIVNIQQSWYAPGSTTKRSVAAPTATTASTFKGVDLQMYPGRNVVEIVVTTGCTVWDVGVELLDQSS